MVVIHSIIAPVTQSEPPSHLKSATRDVSFLRMTQGVDDNLRERPVQRCSEVFGFGAEGQGFVVVIDF